MENINDLRIEFEKGKLIEVRKKFVVLSDAYMDSMDSDVKESELIKFPIVVKWSQSLPTPNNFFERYQDNDEIRKRLQKVIETVDPIFDSVTKDPSLIFIPNNIKDLAYLSVIMHANYAPYGNSGGSVIGWLLKDANKDDFELFLEKIKNKEMPEFMVSEKEIERQNDQTGMGFDVVAGNCAVEGLRKILQDGKGLVESLQMVEKEFSNK